LSADWIIRWIVIAAMAVIDGIWLWAKGIRFVGEPLGGYFIMAGLLLASCLAFSLVAQRKKTLSTVLLGTSDFFYSLTQLLLMVPPVITLSYLAASLNLPLADRFLARADALLGFDWPSVSTWMSSHPWLSAALTFTYTTILWQPFLIMFLTSVNAPGSANSEFIWTFLLSALVAIAISGLVPAFGYEGVIGMPHLDTLRGIREGAWTTLDIRKVDGIITFPSFHAAVGILFLHSVWRVRWAFCILAPLNVALILSTPTVGGHYLVDVIAGILVASLSIALVRRLRAWTAPQSNEWMAWLPGALAPEAGHEP
jgi:membrane-associated phospholipid phosphatase